MCMPWGKERESTHTVMSRKSHGKQTNKIAFFVWQRGAAQLAQVVVAEPLTTSKWSATTPTLDKGS